VNFTPNKSTVLLRDAVIVRLPARAGKTTPTPASFEFAFARVVRDKIVQSGRASAAELPLASDIVLLVAAEDVLLLERSLPPLTERKMRQALPALIEDATLADIATLHVAAGASKGGKRLLAVIDRAVMSAWLAYFSERGRRVTRIWCEALAQPYSSASWSLSVRRDALAPGAILRTARAAVLALSGDAKKDEALIGHIAGLGTNQAEIALFGEPEIIAGYQTIFRTFGFSVRTPGRDALAAWLASERDEAPLDLLQGEFGGSGFSVESLRHWQAVALLILAALCIDTLGLVLRASQLHADKRELIAEQSETLKRAFPDTGAVLDAPAQMRRALAQLQARRGATSASDFETFVGDAGTLLGGLPPNSTSEMHYESGSLTLHLKTPLLSDAASQAALARTAGTLGASATIIPASGDGGITIRLAAKAQP